MLNNQINSDKLKKIVSAEHHQWEKKLHNMHHSKQKIKNLSFGNLSQKYSCNENANHVKEISHYRIEDQLRQSINLGYVTPPLKQVAQKKMSLPMNKSTSAQSRKSIAQFPIQFNIQNQTRKSFNRTPEILLSQNKEKKFPINFKILTEKCLNHQMLQAQYYLLSQGQYPKNENKLYFCKECGQKIQQQGFAIHYLGNQNMQKREFMSKLNESITMIGSKLQILREKKYKDWVEKQICEIDSKYNSIIEILLEFRKEEVLEIERYKFQIFQYVTKHEKQLQATLKKIERIYQTYNGKLNVKPKEQEFYWNLLEKQQDIIHTNIEQPLQAFKIKENVILPEEKICEKVLKAVKQRIYELSFEEDSSDTLIFPQTSRIGGDLNATFGERQNQIGNQ